MSDDTIRFHVIQSVKGGCGKTAFSLMKSIQLAEKIQVNENSKARVLYLDCDFRGSALKVLLYGLNNVLPIGVEGSEQVGYVDLEPDKDNLYIDGRLIDFNTGYSDCKTLSEFLEQVQQVDLKDIIVHGCSYIDRDNAIVPDTYENKYTITGKIDFIFSPSEAEGKKAFNYTMLHSRGDATLNIGVFQLRMRELFKKILRYGRQKEEHSPTYTDVVLDMPPGSDEYSGALLREIKELNKKIDIRYYNLTTMERGHMYTTVEHIAQLLEAGIEEKAIYCVFTEMAENEFAKDENKEDENNYEKLAENFGIIFDKSEKMFGRLKENMHYLASRFSPIYYSTTRSNKEAIRIQNKISELQYSDLQI